MRNERFEMSGRQPDASDKLSIKDKIVYSMAAFSYLAGVVAVYVGIFLPPRGEVHASILTFLGITLTFSGSLLGITAHYSSVKV